MFKKVLIANRGAIACRIIRTLKAMNVGAVSVYSTADAGSLHVALADEAICIGEGPASESYLLVDKIIAAAINSGAQAIHPGYGFLSENAEFARRCESRGIVFIGPDAHQIEAFGLKHTARQLAKDNNVPLLPGTGLLSDVSSAVEAATGMGYPVMLKSTAGGGGIGMQLCRHGKELQDAFSRVARLAKKNFANAGLYLEKFVEHARHIEVQIFGDGKGGVIALGERDCSLQRRHQKVVEETPAPHLRQETRRYLLDVAEQLGKAIQYRNVGTVEFIYDVDTGNFYFLEVNTRLQVEHGVTEVVTGIDLVEWMVRQSAGELEELETLRPAMQGHAIQVRLYAEDPGKQFQPSTGLITHAHFSNNIRVDTWVEAGVEVSPFYDPMLAKFIASADTRQQAIDKLHNALDEMLLAGVENNGLYLKKILQDDVFRRGQVTTKYLNDFAYHVNTVDVLKAGTQTTIQDYPAREGYWHVGIPPSGPMDDYAFRWGNRLLGNDESAAGLEFTVTGPTLKFNAATTIVMTGAMMTAELNGQAVTFWKTLDVTAGAILKLGAIEDTGVRSYLCVQNGFDVPKYLGSKSTFTLGQFGGHGGRTLQMGDVLHFPVSSAAVIPAQLPLQNIPRYDHHWQIHVIYGPHGAPDFFTPDDIDTFFTTDWEVHYNSSRTGVRLIGPKPEWARSDGGEAGLHPSNIHDNAYAIGTVDFTGDMPVILGPDGPSLGGFVCPATIITAERWKMGQLRPGDTVRFIAVSQDEANEQERTKIRCLESFASPPVTAPIAVVRQTSQGHPVIRELSAKHHPVGVCYRPSGDKYLLVEYGPLVLDIKLRFRVHALMLTLQAKRVEGIRELTPGIRSLQIHYDSLSLSLSYLLDMLVALENELGDIDALQVPARIVHLPLSWDDSQTRLAIDKYVQSVRKDAPWCPSNIEFIRRINGLDSIDEVKQIVFEASYLVMGLGDVYLGAPVATPLDPRHRLVTTKYNPARTWTPENAVGIGGAYLCVYGMEGPGGYQFVGRTVQMWNRWKKTRDFSQPWLLRFFDQIRFYPVSEAALLQMREDFPRGKIQLHVEETTFKLSEYLKFLDIHRDDINAFQSKQQRAFYEERERWKALGVADFNHEVECMNDTENGLVAGEYHEIITSHVHGSVWKLHVSEGDVVEVGQSILVLESMKMEITIHAEQCGIVSHLLCQLGNQVKPGQHLVVLDTNTKQ
ncbi:MAG: urea carboxylase [Gammaproteobacteria bacterium]|nr:urea carboxylase [Gammaproteobacteria bacterium]